MNLKKPLLNPFYQQQRQPLFFCIDETLPKEKDDFCKLYAIGKAQVTFISITEDSLCLVNFAKINRILKVCHPRLIESQRLEKENGSLISHANGIE